MNCEFEDKIFNAKPEEFELLALELFRFQAATNLVYAEYLRALGIEVEQVRSLEQIPFLPISLFKSQRVICGKFEPEIVFESSGTTGSVNSRHEVKKLGLYKTSFLKAFNLFYGEPAAFCIIGLLPSYLERSASSLVMMVDELIKTSGHPDSGFYLYDHEALHKVLLSLEANNQPSLLIGVSFALLDFGEKFQMKLRHCSIMETGGMKGRRMELTRPELHQQIGQMLGVSAVHSEYGMTELLSQAYSTSDGLFRCPPWMRVMIREDDDPLSVLPAGKGLLNVIDLANIYSCSFIATDDIGAVYADNSFEVQGRMDNSDIRGCSLMVV